MFTRRKAVDLEGDAGYFYQGSGKVRRLSDGFAVTPFEQEVVVKYRYHPMLRAYPDGAAELYQVPVFLEDRGGGQSEQAYFVGIRTTQGGDRSEIRIGFYDSGA